MTAKRKTKLQKARKRGEDYKIMIRNLENELHYTYSQLAKQIIELSGRPPKPINFKKDAAHLYSSYVVNHTINEISENKSKLEKYIEENDKKIKNKSDYTCPKDFYNSPEWKALRYAAIKKYGKRCECCGANDKATVFHVDHIKPKSIYPQLSLDINNLQILCEACNMGKLDMDETDWRS